MMLGENLFFFWRDVKSVPIISGKRRGGVCLAKNKNKGDLLLLLAGHTSKKYRSDASTADKNFLEALTGRVSTEVSEYCQLLGIEDRIRGIVKGHDARGESACLEHVRDAGSGVCIGRHLM